MKKQCYNLLVFRSQEDYGLRFRFVRVSWASADVISSRSWQFSTASVIMIFRITCVLREIFSEDLKLDKTLFIPCNDICIDDDNLFLLIGKSGLSSLESEQIRGRNFSTYICTEVISSSVKCTFAFFPFFLVLWILILMR